MQELWSSVLAGVSVERAVVTVALGVLVAVWRAALAPIDDEE